VASSALALSRVRSAVASRAFASSFALRLLASDAICFSIHASIHV
jgi:hypothetical protein